MADKVNSISYYVERLSSLRSERESFISHWREISEHISPRMSRFFVQDRNRGDKRNNKILNERATLALRILRSGMMSGVTNPARPWLALKTPDPGLNEFKPVKLFLETLRDRMMQLFLRSNLYTTLPMAYGDQGAYGTTAYLALEDPESLLRCYHYPVGSYMLAADHRGRMDTCYREFSMTARQMVAKFGKDKCSHTTQKLAEQGAGKESWVEVCHAIEPNAEYQPGKAHFAHYKKFHSCYFEKGGDADKKLHSGGFDRNPIISPRWDVTGEDVYGSSPGMEALGTVKQLQLREKRKGQMIDKGVAPPMKGPASLKTMRNSILAGDMTYIDSSAPNAEKFEPVLIVDPRWLQPVNEDIQRCEVRIDECFYVPLFLMIARDPQGDKTATEVAVLQEEKLLQLGPVYLRQNDEHFDPLVDLTFDYMAKNQIIPPIPQEMMDMDIGVEYISIMSQAMKMVGVGGLERSMAFAGSMLQAWPEVRHMVNPFNAVSEYFNTAGASPKVLNDKKEYEAAILAEKRQQQAMQLAQAAPVAADTAKTLSETKLDGEDETALSRVSDMAMNRQAAA